MTSTGMGDGVRLRWTHMDGGGGSSPMWTSTQKIKIRVHCRVVNATLKKYRRYRYPLKFNSIGATATATRNSYNKVAYATGRRLKTKAPRRKGWKSVHPGRQPHPRVAVA